MLSLLSYQTNITGAFPPYSTYPVTSSDFPRRQQGIAKNVDGLTTKKGFEIE